MTIDRPIDEGELLAYLDGERRPHVVQALQRSAALRADLEALRHANRQFQHLFSTSGAGHPQDIVDAALNQLARSQHRRVRAALQQSSLTREQLTDLQRQQRLSTRSRPLVPSPPRDMRNGLRSAGDGDQMQVFRATTLHAQVTLRLIPPRGEYWEIEGHVTQNNVPVDQARVALRTATRRLPPLHTDESGFFRFTSLAAGLYRLQVSLQHALLFIPHIELADD